MKSINNLICKECIISSWKENFVIILILATNCQIALSQDETASMGVNPTRIVSGNGYITYSYNGQGKLISYYTPSVGSYNVIPYQTLNNEHLPYYGAEEYMGVFPGIEIDGNFIWFYRIPDIRLEYPDEESPLVRITFSLKVTDGFIKITLESIAGDPDDPLTRFSFVQAFRIENNCSGSHLIKLIFYGHIHPTIKNQNPQLHYPGTWPDKLFGWDYNYPGRTAASKKDGSIIILKPESGHTGQYVTIGASLNNGQTVASFEQNSIGVTNDCWLGDKIFSSSGITFNNKDSCVDNKVNFAVKYDLGVLKENEISNCNVFLSSSIHDLQQAEYQLQHAIGLGLERFIEKGKQWWKGQNYLQVCDNLTLKKTLSNNEQEYIKKLLKRWIITCRLNVDTESGAIIASPNFSPKYYHVWIRDGIFQAMLWEALGKQTGDYKIVNNFINFLINRLDNRYYWAQSYYCLPDPDWYPGGNYYSGLPRLLTVPFAAYYDLDWKDGLMEYDQMAIFLWFIDLIRKNRGIDPFTIRSTLLTKSTYESIANELILDIVNDPRFGEKRGLLKPSMDWNEFPAGNGLGAIFNAFFDAKKTTLSQSLYTNAALVSGLRGAAAVTSNNNYKIKAGSVFESIEHYFTNDKFGFYPPGYSLLVQVDWELYVPPIFPFIGLKTQVKHTVASEAKRNNIFTLAWPFSTFCWNDPRIDMYKREIIEKIFEEQKSLLDDDQRGCFVPSYLCAALYEQYSPGDDPSKIFEIINGLKSNPEYVKTNYIGENFFTKDDFHFRGSLPLGWSHAWGALSLLELGDIELPVYPDVNDCSQTNADNYIIFLIDVSGSMQGGKIAQVKNAIPGIVKELSAGNNLYAIILYSSRFGLCIPENMPIIQSFSNDLNELTDNVSKLFAGGDTPMFPGIEKAYAYAGKNIPENKKGMIILLCDGEQNCPQDYPKSPALDSIIIRYLPLGRNNITLSTIAYGTSTGSGELQRLAKEGGGVYIEARDEDVIKGKFRELIMARSMPEEKLRTAAVYAGTFVLLLLISSLKAFFIKL